MTSSLTLLVIHCGTRNYLMAFASSDELGVRPGKTASLEEPKGLEEVSNGLAIGYDLHSHVTSRKVDDD